MTKVACGIRLGVALFLIAAGCDGSWATACADAGQCGANNDALPITADLGGPDIGGACTYTETAGTANIKSISVAPANENNCPMEPTKVLFDFVPADPSFVPPPALGLDPIPNTDRRLSIDDGKNPPNSCLEPVGIIVGAMLPAVRQDITSGTCSPTLFYLTSVDLIACTNNCF
jgi:hypothetical protein